MKLRPTLFTALIGAPLLACALPSLADTTGLISVRDRSLTPYAAASASRGTVISADGRFTAFHSGSPDFVRNDTNHRVDVFVVNRQSGAIEKISRGLNGEPANSDSEFPALSANGRYVAFLSAASNLVPNDTNSVIDVFVYDRVTQTTSRVNVSSSGGESNEGMNFYSDSTTGSPLAISADGRFVAFESHATNLVPGANSSMYRIYVHDRQTGSTTVQSVGVDGAFVSFNAVNPSMSADGRYLVFQPLAYLLPDDPEDSNSIYLRDLRAHTTTQVSPTGGIGASISSSGNFISYVHGDIVYAYDRRTEQASAVSAGTSSEPEVSNPVISSDGRYLAYESGWPQEIHLRDRVTGSLSIVATGVPVFWWPEGSVYPSISADGAFVAYTSDAPKLVPYDINEWPDAFVYNRETASNSLMSAAKIPSSTPVAGAFNDRYAVTTYGRQVAFRSLSALLADHDTNGYIDSFVRDRAARTTTRVSISSTGAETNADVGETVISANGRYAAFVTAASTLYPGDVNYRDLFLRDLQTGEITRINIAPDGSPQTDYPPEYEPSSPSMSADARFIAFTTGADNFLPAGYGGNQVFVRDRQAGTTEIVSSPATSGREYAITGYTSISADGRFVAFDSNSANLAPAGSSGYSQVYVRDRQTGQLTLVSHSATGVGVGGDEPVISADGRHVVFSSDSPNLVTGDTNGATDIFDFNLQTGVITRVSMAANGAQGNDDSGAPALSGSGRYIVFSSYAENLVATDENHQPDIFVRDMQTGATKLVSLTTAGEQANDGSYYPAISADGLTIVFSSRATNLVAADNNGAGDVFVRRVTN